MAKLLEPFGGGLACDDPALNVFDIHGGGVDLVFPHHENEIAQSCCAFGSKRMANYWMHNGFLQVEGEKMAKSLGNFVTIRELLDTPDFGGRKWSGEVLRFAMLRTHYRQPIDWTIRALEEAESTLDRWYDAVGDAKPSGEVAPAVLDALSDDLNTPAAISELHKLTGQWGDSRFINPAAGALRSIGTAWEDPALLKSSANLLGLLQQTRTERTAATLKEAAIDTAFVESLIAIRAAARAAKNWAESDRLRDEIAAMGVAIKDNKDGTTSWEPKR